MSGESIATDDSKTKAEVKKVVVSEVAERMAGDPDHEKELEEKLELELSAQEKIARKYALEQHGYDADADEESQEDDEVNMDSNGDEDVGDAIDGEDDDKHLSDPEMVEANINGTVVKVDKAKVEAAGGLEIYQKRRAAEEKLKEAGEASRLLDDQAEKLQIWERELKAKQEALSSGSDAQNQGSQTDLPKNKGDQTKALKDQAKKVRELLYEGDDDAFDQALVDMLTVAQNSNATQADIVNELGEKAATKAFEKLQASNYEQNRLAAVNAFETDFPEISSDPRLRAMANQESGRVKAEHPDWNPEQIIREAAQRTKDWLEGFTGSGEGDSTADVDAERQARIDKKRSNTTVKAGSGRASAKQQQTETESRRDYVARLKKDRGLE